MRNEVAAYSPQPSAATPRPGENGVILTPHESRPGADETHGCGGWFIGGVWRAMANAHVSLGWPLHAPRSDHHLGSTPRGPSPVPALLSRHAAMIALGVIPLLVFGAVAMARPPAPIAPKPVATEGVRVIRMDATTFRGRWSPVNDLAPATVIHEVGGGGAQLRDASKPAAVPAMTRPPARLVKRAALRLDLCSRHGLRRVTYSVRGYQHWRCRR